MKRVKFFAILLCAFSLVAFCGCSKDEDEPATTQQTDNGNPDPEPEPTLEEMVVGTWNGQYNATLGNLNFSITFSDDHTGVVSTIVLTQPLNGNLTWLVDEEARTLTAVINLSLLSDPNIVGTVVSINETTMVVNATILRQTKEVTLTRVSAE